MMHLIKTIILITFLSLTACAGMGNVVDTDAGVGPASGY